MKIPLLQLRAEGRVLAEIRFGIEDPNQWSNPPKVTFNAMISFVKLNERQISCYLAVTNYIDKNESNIF